MPTQKQLEANRLNARKSTGPRSIQGKARSSMNALKSGIDAKAQIIRGEKAANLEALKAEYYQRFRPTTPIQRMLVDTLIDCEWLLRRFRVCEAQLWEQGAGSAFRPDAALEAAQSFKGNADYFTRLQRRIDAAHRNYRNALHELRRQQAGEDHDPEPDPVPATLRRERTKPQNGFVPHHSPILDSPAPPNGQPALHLEPSPLGNLPDKTTPEF